jgi:filamentous hemagglutinin family protein
MAITMGQLRSGGVPMAGGGRGSAPNLQNAGAESAQRTADLARQSQLKSEEALKAMEKLQETARVTASAETQIKNGLSADFLHPHDGFDGNGKPLTTSWRGTAINLQKTGLQSSGDHHVEITQSEQNAYLYWKNFNVGPRTTINFNQSAGGADKTKWIAFNKITGTASPTSIYGKIKADGQVYILNQNGIMVHNGAEVNVHSLVASTLPINGNLAGDYDPRLSKNLQLEGRGIANNPDRQFLFSALEMKPAAAVSGSERFVPRVETIEKEGVRMEGAGAWVDEKGSLKSASGESLEGKAVFGNVAVQRGAQLTVGGANSSSGLLLLAAPNVINEGKISAPQGQVILASGLQVGVAPHDANDPSLRGLDVTIGKVLAQLANPGITVTPVSAGLLSPLGRDYGTAWQGGLILAPSGNLTIAGADVSHQGVTMATTSVSLNGRIDLLANYGAELNPDYNDDGSKGEPVLRKGAGLVRIGSFDDALGIPRASLIAVLPDWSSGEVIEGSRLAINSLVSVMGGNISMGSDAMIWAPGASSSRFAVGETRSQTGEILTKGVTLSAGSWEDYGNTTAQPEDRAPFFLHDSGSIHLAAGSVIDVAGSTGIKVDGAQNHLKVQLRGPELANSPLQRQSPIRGKDITVDIRISGEYDGQYWVGTPLGDVTGYLGLIRRSVGELTIDGGTIGMEAGESISLGRDSLLNVSGGWKEYGGGSFKQTMIRYRNQLIPIWQATPDRVYDGIAPFDYKITEKAYIEGGNGGNIMLQAASLGLDGQLQGLTVLGERQLRVAPDLLSSRPPSRSGLEIHVIAQKYEPRVTSAGVSGTKFALNVSPYAPAIRFESGRGESLPGFDLTGTLPQSRQQKILLDPSAIKGSGFGRLVLENHDGMVVLPAGSVLDLGVRGSLGIEASRIDFGGSCRIHFTLGLHASLRSSATIQPPRFQAPRSLSFGTVPTSLHGTRARIWRCLRAAGRDYQDLHCPESQGGHYHGSCPQGSHARRCWLHFPACRLCHRCVGVGHR